MEQRMKDQKLGSDLARNQDLLKGKDYNGKFKFFLSYQNWETWRAN